MKSKIYKPCKTEKDKKNLKELLDTNEFLLNHIRTILEDDLRRLTKEKVSSKRYDDQSWAYKQADYNGSQRTYEEIISLLTIGE